MSIANFLNRWLKRLYKLLAIFLVLVAFSISFLRLSLPYAHYYHSNIENYLQQQFSVNITIKSFSMDWQDYGPSLLAHDVLLSAENNTTIDIKSVAIEIDFWRSVKAWKFVTQDFVINGAEIVLKDNTIIAQTDQSVSSSEPEKIETVLSSLLLEQISHFSIRDSHIVYQFQTNNRSVTIDEMFWFNEGEKHNAQGKIILDGISSNKINVSLDVKGSDFKSLTGKAYLTAEQINIATWLDKGLNLNNENIFSAVNFQTWINFNEGNIVSAHIALGENVIGWQNNQQDQTLAIVEGDVAFSLLDNQSYQIVSTPLEIIRNGKVIDKLSFNTRMSEQGIEGFISGFDLASIDGVFPLFYDNDPKKDFLNQLSLSGKVQNIAFFHNNKQTAITAQFADIQTHYSQGFPALKNVAGELTYLNNQFHFSLNAKENALDFEDHFKKPIRYSTLSADIYGQFSQGMYQIYSDNVSLYSDMASLDAAFKLQKKPQKNIEMSLLATLADVDAKLAPYFYPEILMGDNLVNYLNQSIVDGQVEQAVILFNGALDQFPFKDKQGTFVVDGELSDSHFVFDPQWPAIEHFDANLNFTNNSMLITAREGKLSGVDAKGVNAIIEDLLDQQILVINNKFVNVKPNAIEQLMAESPFRDTIGLTLKRLKIKHVVDSYFSLELPLNNTEKAIAKGYVDFENNQMMLSSPSMKFSQVNGRLSYENQKLVADNIELSWRGLPLSVQVSTEDYDNKYQVNLDMIANWQDQQWQQQLSQSLQEYGQGTINWQGNLQLSFAEHYFKYDFKAKANLADLSITLPAPLFKEKDVEASVNIHAFGNDSSSTINATFGKQLDFYGLLQHQQPYFSLAHVVIGKQQQWLPTEGVHITADLTEAQYHQWHPVIADILTATSHTQASRPESVDNDKSDMQFSDLFPLKSIHGQIERLHIYGEQLNAVNFDFIPQENWWLANISSKELRGSSKIYPDWLQQGLDINLDYFHLAAQDENKQTIAQTKGNSIRKKNTDIDHIANQLLFNNIPPIKFTCGSCRYGLYNFGDVSFSLERDKGKNLLLKNFKAKRGKDKINLEARWLQTNEYASTQIKGDYFTNSIEREIENLGYSSIIKDSDAKLTYDVNWLGSPFDYTLQNLQGSLSATLGDGYLEDVDDQGVSILSLLSLQSLVRKLSFDFRDIFSDGMFYRKFSGDFLIHDGNAYTDNLNMKGSAGDLMIKGNTDFIENQLDYRMSYKPNLTSSLPVLAWIATTNPVTFIAGLALDEVITSTVVSEINFEVTGDIAQPNIKQVSKKNKNISVGRTTPPQIVDNNVEDTMHNEQNNQKKNKVIKEEVNNNG